MLKLILAPAVFFIFLSSYAQAFDISCQVVKINNQEVSETLFLDLYLTSSRSLSLEISDPVKQTKERQVMYWNKSFYIQNDSQKLSIEGGKKSFFNQYSFRLDRKKQTAVFTLNKDVFELAYCN